MIYKILNLPSRAIRNNRRHLPMVKKDQKKLVDPKMTGSENPQVVEIDNRLQAQIL